MGSSCCTETDYSVTFDEQRIKALKHKPRSASSNRTHHPSAENGDSDVIAEIATHDFLIVVSPQLQKQQLGDADVSVVRNNFSPPPHQARGKIVPQSTTIENDPSLVSPVAGRGGSVFSLRSLASDERPSDNARNEAVINPLCSPM